MGPTGRRHDRHALATGVKEFADGLTNLVATLGSGPGRVVGSRLFSVAVNEEGKQGELSFLVQEHQWIDDGVGQSPVPSVKGTGGSHVHPVAYQVVTHVLGEALGTLEGVLGIRIGVPEIGLGRAAEGIAVRRVAGVKAEWRQVVL